MGQKLKQVFGVCGTNRPAGRRAKWRKPGSSLGSYFSRVYDRAAHSSLQALAVALQLELLNACSGKPRALLAFLVTAGQLLTPGGLEQKLVGRGASHPLDHRSSQLFSFLYRLPRDDHDVVCIVHPVNVWVARRSRDEGRVSWENGRVGVRHGRAEGSLVERQDCFLDGGEERGPAAESSYNSADDEVPQVIGQFFLQDQL